MFEPHLPRHRDRRNLSEGIDQAIRNGIERAAKTLRHIDWFEVTQVRGQVKDGAVEHFQVGSRSASGSRTTEGADTRPRLRRRSAAAPLALTPAACPLGL